MTIIEIRSVTKGSTDCHEWQEFMRKLATCEYRMRGLHIYESGKELIKIPEGAQVFPKEVIDGDNL